MARFQQLANTRAKMAAAVALAAATEKGAGEDESAELVRLAEVRARAMTPDALHAEVQSVHEDVVRIVGDLTDEELALRLRDMEQALRISEQRRRANAEQTTRMQEEQSETLADLRRQIRAGEDERDRAAEDRAEELERLRHQLTVVKGAGMDADIALRRRQREAAARDEANVEALGELDEKKTELQAQESRVRELSTEMQRLEAQRSTMGEAIEAVAEMLQHGAELAAAEAAAAAPPEDPEEDKENASPRNQASKDPMEAMGEMERKLADTCAQIRQRDAEIAELREVVTQECVQRTQMLTTLKRAGIR
jgi:hypothetical protein